MRTPAWHSPAGGRGTSPFARSCCVIALLLAMGALVVSPQSQARTAPVRSLEAEDATDWLDVGGSSIQIVACSAARGALAVDGVDWPGDWIAWDLSLTEDFYFRDSLRTAGSIGLTRTFVVQFLPAAGGPPVATDTLRTPPGAGVG